MSFFKDYAENEPGKLVLDLFLLFKNALYKVKASGLQLGFNIFRQPSTWDAIKTKCTKLQIIDPKICSILIFQERVWEQFLHHILCICFSVCLSLLLEMLGSLCIAIVCFPGCDVINFEINLIFLIMSFVYMTKKLKQKLKYLENEKSFQGAIKNIFDHFQRAVSCQKFS